MTYKTVVTSAAIAASAALALPAYADVTNGGFETGDFTGWVQTGDASFTGIDTFAARSGTYGAFFGPTSVGGISQSFATVASTSSANARSSAWTRSTRRIDRSSSGW